MGINKKSFYLIILFAIFCLVIINLRTELLNSYSLIDLLYIDRGFNYENLNFIDDSFKYEKSLLGGDNLILWNGGILLELMLIIPRLLSNGNNTATLLIVYLLNFYIVYQMYKLVGGKNYLFDLLVLPYIAYLSVSFNKEIYTVFTLLIISPISFKKDFYKILGKNYISTFLNSFRVLIGFLSILAVFIGRSRVILGIGFFYILLYGLEALISNKISINKILKRSNIKYFFAFISVFIYLIIFYDVNIIYDNVSLQLSDFSASVNSLENSIFFTLSTIPFAFTAPFPFSLFRLPDIENILSLYNFQLLSYFLLTILSFYRIKLMYLMKIQSKSFQTFLFENKYLISIFLVSTTIVFRGSEITRQIITIILPITHLLSQEINKTKNNQFVG